MSKVNLYIDCGSGISGDMLCRCLTDLSGNAGFVEAQQRIIQERLDEESKQAHHHPHMDGHAHAHEHGHSHPTPYTHRSFQSIVTLLKGSGLEDKVKGTAIRIYTVLATAEAEVHGETLETVHFHEVGRPQAILNVVGIAAAATAIDPGSVFCSKIMDGTGTVKCAHGEIPVPVPAVRALMNHSNLEYGTHKINMELVTPTGLAALIALEPFFMAHPPAPASVLKAAEARGDRRAPVGELPGNLEAMTFC